MTSAGSYPDAARTEETHRGGADFPPSAGHVGPVEAMQRFTEALNAVVSLDSAVREIVAAGRAHLGVAYGSVVVVDDRGGVVAMHSDPLPPDVSRLIARRPTGTRSPAGDALTSAAPVLHSNREDYAAVYPDLREATEALGVHSFAYIPLLIRGRVAGVVSLMWREGHSFDSEERALLVRLGQVGAAAVERARQFERTAQASDALQRAVLPSSLPTLRWVTCSARYLPAEDGVQVGGDWYDAFVAPGGDLWVTVGDVGGHGIAAAAVMAQLRAGVRAACFAGLDPAGALDLLDRMLDATEPDVFATAVIATVGSDGSLRYSSAGHPPPIVVTPEAAARRLDDGRRALLGLGYGGHEAADEALGPGSTLLLYTDGLIERRGEVLDVGIERVLDALGDLDTRDGPGTVADRALASSLLAGGRADDVCVLAVRHLIR